MYAWLWRRLPGPTWLRALITVLALVGVVLVCFEWVFPAVAPHMPFNETTVGE